MWVMGLIMVVVMVFGMHTADGAKHKRSGGKDIPQAVQMDNGYGQNGAGQHQMTSEGGHGSGGQDQDGTAGENGDNDRGKPALSPGSASPGDK